MAGTVEPGEDIDAVIARIAESLEDLPSVQVLDRDGFIGSIVDQITSYITLIQGLLFLSIITALFGIANTLSLSIGERIRELGLLRAVGMDQADVRTSVRLGGAPHLRSSARWSACRWACSCPSPSRRRCRASACRRSPSRVGWLIVILASPPCSAPAAAIRPARRAAGLSILDAIASE